MMAEKMVPLYKSTQKSLTQRMWPQIEHPLTRVEECQARVLSANSHSESLLHPPSLVSRPPPQLRDALVPIPKPMQVLCSPNPRTIRGLLKFHPPHQLIIIRVINDKGLKICLSTQINTSILEHSGEEADYYSKSAI